MGATEKPGETIRHNKKFIEDAILGIVVRFQDATDVTVQSIHYYRTEPDPKMLNDQGKPVVDIILRL